MATIRAEARILAGTNGVKPSWRRYDLERARICQGSEVVSEDLERVGSVRQIIFDASDNLLGITVRLIAVNAEAEVPAGLIVSAADGSLYLQCTGHELCTNPLSAPHSPGTALAVPA